MDPKTLNDVTPQEWDALRQQELSAQHRRRMEREASALARVRATRATQGRSWLLNVGPPRDEGQSRFASGVEAALNVLSGFFISLGVWVFLVIPLWDIQGVHLYDNLGITCLFTVTSLLRSYCWRRIFNSRRKFNV